MKRDIEKDLLIWKNQKRRLPLIIRGARQVGKTYIIEKFGKENFENFININFEIEPEYKDCFQSLDPEKIINAINLISKSNIEFGKTLLFFDEIQECPKAIMALRYFKERIQNLHIIAAGSLLEFTLNDVNFKMPVGRIQFMYLHPMSFNEYLKASKNEKLENYLKNISIKTEIEDIVHKKLLNLVKEYCWIGGMPAVVYEYLKSKNLFQCQNIQNSIINTFRNDFGKYAKRIPHTHLQTIFRKAPGLIGKWLKYTKIDPNIASKTLKRALQKLYDAGLLIPIYATSAAGLPFISFANKKKCKFLFLDIGLAKRSYNLDLKFLFEKNLFLTNEGALKEQFVGQELLSYMEKNNKNDLFSWYKDKKGSSCEIDFLINVDTQIIPIEVKSKSIGTLRSLKIFLEEKNLNLGIRISENPLSLNNKILSIPFYLIAEIPRLIREIYNSKKFSIKKGQ